MADNSILAAYLASRQLAGGQKDPLAARERLAASLSAQGSSTEPVRSWGEGLARSLQGGLGGLIAGYTDKERKDTETGNMSALADYLKTGNADSLKGMKGDLGAMLTAQLASQKMTVGQNADAAASFAQAYGPTAQPATQSGALLQAGGVPQPGYGASSAPGQVTLAQLESSGNPNAVNPQSGATGLYQFMPGTAADVRTKHPELNLPADFRAWTPEQQGAAQQAFQGDNAKVLSSAGIQPTPANLYLAHRAGAQGAQTILNASPDAPLSTVVPPEWIAQNPDMRTTAGQFIAQANQRFPAQASGPAPGVPGQIAQPTQLAQGDSLPSNGTGTPNAPQSATSGPPDVPRPQASPEQIAKYQRLMQGPKGLTPEQAKQGLDKELSDEWIMRRQQALETWKDQQQSKRQNEKAAIDLGQKAPMEMITKRVDNYENKIRPGAIAAVDDINALHTVRQVLDAGAFTGTGASAKTMLAKLGEQFGIPSEQATNTQVLGSALAKRVLAASGGSLGSGFSNADRDFVEQASGGNISLDESAIRRIADIGERSARTKIKQHDEEAGRIQRLPGIGQLGSDQFTIPTAPTYAEFAKANPMQTPTGGAGAAPAAPAVGGGVAEGATATNPQTGQKIMFKGGQWVPAQ